MSRWYWLALSFSAAGGMLMWFCGGELDADTENGVRDDLWLLGAMMFLTGFVLALVAANFIGD